MLEKAIRICIGSQCYTNLASPLPYYRLGCCCFAQRTGENPAALLSAVQSMRDTFSLV